MTDEELKAALDGLFAWDTGCVSSGIKDDNLKHRVAKEVWADCPKMAMHGPRITRLAAELWLAPDAIEAGYGLEDMSSFIEWLDEELRAWL